MKLSTDELYLRFDFLRSHPYFKFILTSSSGVEFRFTHKTHNSSHYGMIFIPTYQDLDFPWKYKKDTVDLEINHKTLFSTPDWFQEIYNESEKVRQDYLKSLRLLKLFK